MMVFPEPFDVCIAWVEFPDHPGVGKPRPVIALSTEDAGLLVIAIKVTSHVPRNGVPGEVALEDWQVEGLNVPSVARCSQVLAVPQDCISRVIGSLTSLDVRRVVVGLEEAGMIAP